MDHIGPQGFRNTVARRPGLAVLGLGLVSNNIPMVRRNSWSGKKCFVSLLLFPSKLDKKGTNRNEVQVFN